MTATLQQTTIPRPCDRDLPARIAILLLIAGMASVPGCATDTANEPAPSFEMQAEAPAEPPQLRSQQVDSAATELHEREQDQRIEQLERELAELKARYGEPLAPTTSPATLPSDSTTLPARVPAP